MESRLLLITGLIAKLLLMTRVLLVGLSLVVLHKLVQCQKVQQILCCGSRDNTTTHQMACTVLPVDPQTLVKQILLMERVVIMLETLYSCLMSGSIHTVVASDTAEELGQDMFD